MKADYAVINAVAKSNETYFRYVDRFWATEDLRYVKKHNPKR